MGIEVYYFVAQGGNHGSLLSMDLQVVPQVHVGHAVGDLNLHLRVCLQVVDQHLGAPWQGAIGYGEFVP